MKKKITKTIGGVVFFVGLFVAVCTVDGTTNEMLLRVTGVAVCAIGAIMATEPTGRKGGDDGEA